MSDVSDLDAMTYEQLVAELETLTAQMAAGDIGIEAAAELYERAGLLHAAAAERLARVQDRIDKLAASDDADQPAAPDRSTLLEPRPPAPAERATSLPPGGPRKSG